MRVAGPGPSGAGKGRSLRPDERPRLRVRGVGGLPVVVAAVVVVASSSMALPVPGEDDAGSGLDAPDASVLSIRPLYFVDDLPGLPITEGSYVGNITEGIDDSDIYDLHPPENSIIRVKFRGEPRRKVSALLSGPDGADGESIGFGEGREAELSKAAPSGGSWDLTFFDGESHPEVPPRKTYEFTVTYEVHDHFRRLDGELEDAAAWRVDIPEGGFGRIEIQLGTPPVREPFQTTEGYDVIKTRFPDGRCTGRLVRFLHPPFGGLAGILFGRLGGGGAPAVWAEVGGHEVQVHRPGPGFPSLGRHTFTTESEVGDLLMEVGLSDSDRVGHAGWVVWDDPVEAKVDRLKAWGETIRLEDFESNETGFGAQVGPVAYAEDRSVTLDIPDNASTTSYVVADGVTPKVGGSGLGDLSTEETTLIVHRPGREPTVLTDDLMVWGHIPNGVGPGGRDVPTGPWTFEMEHSDGAEGDWIRVYRASFGFPQVGRSTCPSEG